MTKEQWIIYLYGIYPEGGWKALWTILLVCFLLFILIIFAIHNVDKQNGESSTLWEELPKQLKIIPIIVLSILIFLSNLVPNKNVFLALVATPTVVKYIKHTLNNDRLKKIDKLFDITLDKMLKDK